MKKPDNIVFNTATKEYDSYKKEYPTSFNSKNFSTEKVARISLGSQPYFKKKLIEIKEQYDILTEELKWNEIIYNSTYNFNPLIGEEYYLYKSKKKQFLSLIKPNEWTLSCIGKFRLRSNNVWEKI